MQVQKTSLNAREKKTNEKTGGRDELFDIAHVDADEVMKNDEGDEFLHLQRAGRKEIIARIDKNEKLRELKMKLQKR